MTHPDKYKSKRYDTPGRCTDFTDTVYSGKRGSPADLRRLISASERQFDPPAPDLSPYIGEMHGHTNLSDGQPDIDTYFANLRDVAKLDFAVVSDHDHGGVGRPELWGETPSKWDLIREKVKAYCTPGRFSTLLAYERDSYPFFNNLIIYFRNHDAELIRGIRDGELTEDELRAILARDDLFVVPHDTYSLSSNADFLALPLDLMPHMIEVISRGDAAEYMGNPAFDEASACEGGFWQDALRRGARIGCIGGSDDHQGRGGQVVESLGYPAMYPGLTGVWAQENTPADIFEALRARRTYAFMGGRADGVMRGRMEIDFRINGHWMGDEMTRPESGDLAIWFSVKADVPVKRVTLVKNCRDYIILRKASQLLFDYRQEQAVDSFYVRVELEDGRFGWTSPVWVGE